MNLLSDLSRAIVLVIGDVSLILCVELVSVKNLPTQSLGGAQELGVRVCVCRSERT
jgi:hypothetical protein